jgi:hypothetical protein
MSADVQPDPVPTPPSNPPVAVKVVISVIVFAHLSAIFVHVLAGGGPFVLKQAASHVRPYLNFMWLDNAYRFYAPNPGDTEVLWYKLIYQDGSSRWTQIPRREDFYLRMPFQRHMSLALLASMRTQQETVDLKTDANSVASLLTFSRPATKQVLTPEGEIIYRSYARHIANTYPEHYLTKAKLAYMECYFCRYIIRQPYQMRENIAMFDPRMLTIQYIGNFDPEGVMSNFEPGFRDRVQDDFFIEQIQNDIVPLLEANAKLPKEQQKDIMTILREYGIPYPLIQPLDAKMTETERQAFFQRPLDRDTMRERYAKIVKRDDIPLRKLPEALNEPEPRKSSAAEKTAETPVRSVQ